MTDAIIPDPGTVTKAGQRNVGTFLVGTGTPAEPWVDAALALPAGTADLVFGTTIRLDVTDNPLELRPDFTTVSLAPELVLVDHPLVLPAETTTDVKLGTTIRLDVADSPLVLASATADVHFGIVLTASDAALALDGGIVHVNPQLHPAVCTDLDLVVLVCTDLDLTTSTAQVLTLAPLDCVEA